MLHGVVNFLKPPGMTSHDAVSFVRRVAGTKRVGHTGTLDPAAAGVLPICIGQATRLVEYLQAGRKTYIAEITFGYETDTLDAIGETISEGDASHIELESLRRVLDAFRGTILQTPPLYSAIKKDGKKLYELARDGVEESEIEIAAREVEIHALFVTRFFAANTLSTRSSDTQRDDSQRNNYPRAMLRIECGSGTYIRSLVRDIGRALGCGATMTFLVRTQNGAFDIADAYTPQDLEHDFASALLPMKEVLRWCAFAIIEDDEAIEKLAKGQQAQAISAVEALRQDREEKSFEEIGLQSKANFHSSDALSLVAFFHSNGNVIALAQSTSDEPTLYKPEKVFFLDRDE